MDEIEDGDAQPAKRIRAPGVRYPGASLQRAFQALSVLDAAGGTATIGTLAARIRMSETNADFVRLVASCRSYGLAEWANTSRSALSLTADGEAALGQNEEAARTARQRAALRPQAFHRVARRLEGRALPSPEDLNEAFVVNGIAPSAASRAARNFVESLTFAGLVEEVGGRQIVRADLPYPEPERGAETVAGRPTAPAPARAAAPSRVALPAHVSSQAVAPTPAVRLSSAGLGVALTVKLDLSGWTPDQVLELVTKLKEAGR